MMRAALLQNMNKTCMTYVRAQGRAALDHISGKRRFEFNQEAVNRALRALKVAGHCVRAQGKASQKWDEMVTSVLATKREINAFYTVHVEPVYHSEARPFDI
jgi:hypothetical protein